MCEKRSTPRHAHAEDGSVVRHARATFSDAAHSEHINGMARENLRIRGKKGNLSPWTSLGASA
jgi:hypothetical protein